MLVWLLVLLLLVSVYMLFIKLYLQIQITQIIL